MICIPGLATVWVADHRRRRDEGVPGGRTDTRIVGRGLGATVSERARICHCSGLREDRCDRLEGHPRTLPLAREHEVPDDRLAGGADDREVLRGLVTWDCGGVSSRSHPRTDQRAQARYPARHPKDY